MSSGSMTSDYSSVAEEGLSNSKGSQGDDRRNYNIRPVTIKQLNNAKSNNDTSIIDGSELRFVKIVGVVITQTPRPQGVDYLVDDGTGLIDVKVWHRNSDETNVKKIDIATNTYAKFFGVYRPKQHITAYIVQPIEDHNEISYHMVEVIYTHLCLTKSTESNLDLKSNIKANSS